jgi:hypothetical protein
MIEATTPAVPAIGAKIHADLQTAVSRGDMTLEQANEALAGSPFAPLAAPAAAPAPSTSAAPSTPTLAQLKADKGFLIDFANGVPAALAKHKQACLAEAGEPVVAPDAMARLEAWEGDPANRERLFNGNAEARAEYDELSKAAYPDAPAGTAAQIDEAFPPAAAEAFDLSGIFTADHGNAINLEALEAEKTMRGWLAEARFSKAIGSAVAQEAARFAPTWQSMDDAGREAHSTEVRAQLHRMWGDQTPARIALAQRLVAEIEKKRPGIRDMLEASGAGSNLRVLVNLGLQAERLAARRGISIDKIMTKARGV